jgi:hypothetical protein
MVVYRKPPFVYFVSPRPPVGFYYVAKAGLELSTLLLRPPMCWDYKCVPPRLATGSLLGIEMTSWEHSKFQIFSGFFLNSLFL